MSTYIKTGYWEKSSNGHKGWLNLDLLIEQISGGGGEGWPLSGNASLTGDVDILGGTTWGVDIQNVSNFSINAGDSIDLNSSIQVIPSYVNIASGSFVSGVDSAIIVRNDGTMGIYSTVPSGASFLTLGDGGFGIQLHSTESLSLTGLGITISSTQGADLVINVDSDGFFGGNLQINLLNVAIFNLSNLGNNSNTQFNGDSITMINDTLNALSINANGQITTGSNTNLTLNPDGSGDIVLQTDSASSGYLIMTGLPTSSAGLPTGAIWLNSNVLTIVP